MRKSDAGGKIPVRRQFRIMKRERIGIWIGAILAGVFLLWPAGARAQGQSPDDFKETIRRLVEQVRELQGRVKVLEAKQGGNVAEPPQPADAPPAEPIRGAPEPSQPKSQEEMRGPCHSMETATAPHLKIQGFTHMCFDATRQQG